MSGLRAIIFDFDGVLADTERLHFRAFRDVLAEDGITLAPEEYAATYLGRSDREVFNALAQDRDLPFDAERLHSLLERKASRYDALVATDEVMVPGAAAAVRAWQHVLPLAVASGARRSEIEHVLRRSDLLGCFAAIVAAEDVSAGKPAPDPYMLALERINQAGSGSAKAERDGHGTSAMIAAHEVVALEDSPAGLASIRAAGMHAVAVATNYPAAALAPRAELVVASVADVDLATLQRLVER